MNDTLAVFVGLILALCVACSTPPQRNVTGCRSSAECPNGSLCLNGSCVQVQPTGDIASGTDATAPSQPDLTPAPDVPQRTADLQTPLEKDSTLPPTDAQIPDRQQPEDLGAPTPDSADTGGEQDTQQTDTADLSSDQQTPKPLAALGEPCASDAQCQSKLCKPLLKQTSNVCVPSAAHCAYDDAGIKFTTRSVCSDSASAALCVNGVWQADTSCPVEAPQCHDGRCVYCEPNQFFCASYSVVARCNSDGSALQESHACSGAAFYCGLSPLGSLSNKCVEICEEGTNGGCQGDLRTVCKGTQWESEPCPGGQVCSGNGQCVAPPFVRVVDLSQTTAFIFDSGLAPIANDGTIALFGALSSTELPLGATVDVAARLWPTDKQPLGPLFFLSGSSPDEIVGTQYLLSIDGLDGTNTRVLTSWTDERQTIDQQSVSTLFTRWWTAKRSSTKTIAVQTALNTSYQSKAVYFSDTSGAIVWSEFRQTGPSPSERIGFAIIGGADGDQLQTGTLIDFKTDQPFAFGWNAVSAARHGSQGFIAAWRRDSTISVSCVDAPLYDASTPQPLGFGDEAPVVAGRFGQPAIVAWAYKHILRFRRVDGSCTPVGSITTVSGLPVQFGQYAIAMWADGRFVVAYQADGNRFDQTGLYAQVFTADGKPVGQPLRLNQPGNSGYALSVSTWGNGSFAVVWAAESGLVGRIVTP